MRFSSFTSKYRSILPVCAAILLLTAVFLLILNSYSKKEDSAIDIPEGNSVTTTLSAAGPINAPASALSGAVDTLTNRMPKVGGLSEEFSESHNLRAFAEIARRRPLEGGMSYANAAVAYCAKVRNLFADLDIKNGERGLMGEQDSIVYAQRQKAAVKLHRKCSEFTEQELSGATAMVSVADLTAKGDRIFMVVEKVLQAKRSSDESMFTDALKSALLSRDPLVLEGIFPQVLFNRNKSSDGVALIFDGAPIPATEVQSAVRAARLVACLYGNWCGSESFEVAANCASTAVCYDNVIEMEKISLHEFAPEQVAIVEKYLNRFKESLDRVETTRYPH